MILPGSMNAADPFRFLTLLCSDGYVYVGRWYQIFVVYSLGDYGVVFTVRYME